MYSASSPVVSHPLGIAAAVMFGSLLLVASISDARTRRIPNALVLVLLVAGLVVSVVTAGIQAVGWSLLAAAIGLLIWIPFYAFRMLGAGDVKLFAGAAAWLAPLQVVDAALLSAFVGGALSIAWIFYESRGGAGVVRILHAARYRQVLVETTEKRRKLPYGIAMSIGLTLTFFGFGFLGP